MTPHQTQLIRQSFAQLVPRAPIVALLFYQRLFVLDPSLRAQFRGDIDAQGRKLMQALQFAVASLDQPDTLVPALEAMGQRHVRYGVADAHYDTVGEALLATLSECLGSAFTREVMDAWGAFYAVVAGAMQRGALVATAPALSSEK